MVLVASKVNDAAKHPTMHVTAAPPPPRQRVIWPQMSVVPCSTANSKTVPSPMMFVPKQRVDKPSSR